MFGGLIGILIIGLINLYTLVLQVKCRNRVGNHIESFSELGMAVLGSWGKGFIDLCITTSQFGFCIAYILFVGN